MYQILPIIASSVLSLPGFQTLPVELWVIILRNLDPASLLTAIRTSSDWRNVCKGDPVLRRRAKEEMKRERQQAQQEFLNPAMYTTVTRIGRTPELFATNVTKLVQKSRSGRNIENPPSLQERSLRVVSRAPKQRSGGGKIRTMRKTASQHHKNIRL